MQYQAVTKCFTLSSSYWHVNEPDVALRAISETSIILLLQSVPFKLCGNPGPQICPLVRVLRQIVLTFCYPLKVTPAHFHIHSQQNSRTPQWLSIGHPLSKPQSHRMNGAGWGMQDTIVGMQCCWKPPPNHADTHSRSDTYTCFHKSRHVEAPSVLLMKFGVGKCTLSQKCINTRLLVWH